MPADAVGPRFARAVEWSAALHRDQVRKGATTPYAAHPLAAAALVLEYGGSETEAIAALLHNVVVDAGVNPKRIRKKFGAKVARIVVGCTERAPQHDGAPDRSPRTWWKRKRRMIRHLAEPDTAIPVLRVKAADALANARMIVADLRRNGPEVWQRFHVGAADQLWYHRSLATVLSRRLPCALTDELRATVGEMERLAGWWFDVGDPQEG